MSAPFITVVIASRNRPELLRLAIESVMEQSFQDFELILVNDGSDQEHLPAMQALCEEYPGRIKRIDLTRYPRGHGQSYSLNTGAYAASGEYVTFLDDDDFWTDMEYLAKVHEAIEANPGADALYANQRAVQIGASDGEVLWLGDLEPLCQRAGLQRQHHVYPVDAAQLLQADGFAHLNCSVIRRQLVLDIQGMDEDIRWECDHDFYLRTIDRAAKILFNPDVVSQHNVPDKTKSGNMTTAISAYQRLNYQLYVFNKAALLAKHPAIIKRGRQHKAYVLRKIVGHLKDEGRYGDACYYSAQAVGMDRSWKWWVQHLVLCLRRVFR